MGFFTRDRAPAAGLEPDPLRTPDDAYETGLLIGLTGSPARGLAAKNMKDRLVLWGKEQLGEEPGVRRAGKVAGKRAGSPPRP